ncbi:MAG TPA: hypothetical protein VF175_19600 [Lacipirellula sp.]
MNRTLSACLLAATVCLTPAARGGILYERSLMVDRSVNIFTTSLFDLEFVFGDAYFTPSNPVKLFEGLSITPTSVGMVFEKTLADVDLQSVAGRITDGLDQYIQLVLEETASGRKEKRGWQESGFFLGHGSTEDPDLAGATVEGIQLRIDDFVLAQNSSAAALASSGPQVQVQMTFTVLGVPEPSTLALGALGLAMLVRTAYTNGAGRRRRCA